jgi:glucose/arabinose dehydrogenase
MLIAESGYHGGGASKVSRIEPNGSKTILAQDPAFGDEIPVTSVASYQGRVYVVHGGTVSTIEPGGQLRDVITGLPGQGDHQANQLVFKDGFMYVSIGTVTNSSVVGPDNAVFGWLNKPKLAQLHDVPCQDVVLSGRNFESEHSPGDRPGRQVTSAYSPYGTTLPAGARIPGNPKCNGAVLRARPDGTGLEVFAWGFRNPYGLDIGPDGALYATMHGFDARGSRPIENAWDCVYRVDQGSWYGWPDFACDVPVTDPRFKTKDKPQPQFVLAAHPTETPPRPIAKFNPHAATNGFAFSPSGMWGPPTTAYIALFGDFTPATGTVDRPRGAKVVKLDTATGAVSDFIMNETPGQASRHSGGGLEHPSDVTFGPDGAMYIADWGVARVSEKGLVLAHDTGVIWKVSPGKAERPFPGGRSLAYTLAGAVALLGGTLVVGAGRSRTRRAVDGLWAGAVAGVVMGGFTMFVAAPALDLPWHAPPRVLATLVMGRDAVAHILEFDLVPFLVGVGVLVVLTVVLGAVFAALVRARAGWRVVLAALLYSLTGWALLQYAVFPLVQPLITEKGFTPQWYALSFAVYGVVLGALLALRPVDREGAPPRAAPAAAAPAAPAARPERRRGEATVLSERERMEEWRRRRGQLRHGQGGGPE